MSMHRTRKPCSARAPAKLMAVVVLPTPPFWFAIAMTLATVFNLARSAVAWKSLGSYAIAHRNWRRQRRVSSPLRWLGDATALHPLPGSWFIHRIAQLFTDSVDNSARSPLSELATSTLNVQTGTRVRHPGPSVSLRKDASASGSRPIGSPRDVENPRGTWALPGSAT